VVTFEHLQREICAKRCLLAMVGLLVLSAWHAANASDVDSDIDSNLAIGTGYDSVAHRARGDCVQRTVLEKDKGAGGQRKVIFNMLQVDSYKSLAEKLDLGASADIAFTGGDVHGKAQLSRSFEMNQYSIYALVSVYVENSTQRMRDVTLKSGYWTELLRQNPKVFEFKCGSEFVVGDIIGGEYNSVIEIKTSSSEERSRLSASLGASYGVSSAQSEFSQSLLKIAKDHEIHVFSYQTGGSGTVIATTVDDMVKNATTFPNVVQQNGVVFRFNTVEYSQIPLPVGANPVDVKNQKKVIAYIFETAATSEQLLADIDYITRYPKEFRNPDLPALTEGAKATRVQLNKLAAAASLCYDDHAQCKYPEDFQPPTVKLPERVKSAAESCKNPIFVERKDALCGVALYNEGRGEACGPDMFREGTGPACGVELYHEKQDARCGVLLYFDAPNPACGTHEGPHWPGVYGAGADESCRAAGYPLGSDGNHCHVANSCRTPSNGVERYASCRDESFGVEKFKSCRNAAFGVEQYKLCRDKIFGNADYNVCRKPEFGFERCAD